MLIYNIGILLFNGGMRIARHFNGKAKLRWDGLADIFSRMKQVIDPSAPLIWIHAASLGEFEQGRPIIEAIRAAHPEYKVLLTFFSPSGYQIRKKYDGADYVFYLPIDTPRNARRFVAIARPRVAVFIKYEFWLNYLRQLAKAGCHTFLISAIFHPEQIFFKWYGGSFRKGLRMFEHLFVQNSASRMQLQSLGIDNVTVTGDTRFDRVAAVAASARRIEAIEQFAAGRPLLVAGSTWPADDFLIMELIRRHPELRFVVVPHEIDPQGIERFIARSPRRVVRYTEWKDGTQDAEVMVVDVIGILSSIYQYGSYAYIGGGFGVGIHNTLEAAAFGIPVAFGPNYHRFKEACDLLGTGAAVSVESADELDEWLVALQRDKEAYDRCCDSAASYIAHNKGATQRILDHIFTQE